MAIIALNVGSSLYSLVTALVDDGKYASPQNFFEVAAWNQLTLEEGGEPEAANSRRRTDAVSNRTSATDGKRQGDPTGDSKNDLAGVSEWQPALRRVAVEPDDFPSPVPLADTTRALWGQTNRVLPIALGVRVLAHLLGEQDRVRTSVWHERAAGLAVVLRGQMLRWDEQAGHGRGARWATGFPTENPASTHRFVNQFLGIPRAGKLPDGGAAFLGFVEFENLDDDSCVTLTSSGAEWVSFDNPIFDGAGDLPERTFGAEEALFFLNHLRRYREGEYRVVNSVAALVAEGLSRTQIDESLARQYPLWKKFISTMRSGALGRLTDLGVIGRTRRGLEVDYYLTPLASKLGLPDATAGIHP
jgi:hypothetical protein